MEMSFDIRLASAYKSPSQRARVLTESWVREQMYCPSCGSSSLDKYPNNTPVGDFYCAQCKEDYELKSKRNTLGSKLVDGEYDAMMRCLRSGEVPSIFALTYDVLKGCILDFIVIPNHFFVPAIIEKRKPLAKTAKRARWTGCNILIHQIPQAGRVSIVSKGTPVEKPFVLRAWKHTLFLREQTKLEKRGWILDVMTCIERIERPEFALSDVYQYESELSKLHPDNRHIRDKIRQQLQFLRDIGYLDFLGKGRYAVK